MRYGKTIWVQFAVAAIALVNATLPLLALISCPFNMPGYGAEQSYEINGGNVRNLTVSDWGVAAAALQRGAEAMLHASTAGDVRPLMDPDAGTGWKLAAAASIALDAAGVGNVPGVSTGTARQVAKEAAQTAKVLQTGGHTLNNSTLKGLDLTKEQAKGALEKLKKANGIPNDSHNKIMNNGDIFDSSGEYIDNIRLYLP
jgi:hypothetical protein